MNNLSDPAQTWADISSNNGPPGAFNAHAYKSAGHKLIGIKATESTGYTSPRYLGWVRAAHAAGLAAAHYHFGRPENGDPQGQARHFWSVVQEHFLRGRDRLVIDLETPIHDPREGGRWVPEFDREIERLVGDAPADRLIGYTFLSYFHEAGAPVLRSRAWWLAAWGPLMREREALPGGQYLWAHQFSDGRIGPEPHHFAGIAGTCDGSVINRRSLALIEDALGKAPVVVKR